jgi:hypothetical protein
VLDCFQEKAMLEARSKKQTRSCGAPVVCCRSLAIGNDIAPTWGTRLHPSPAEL